jgi:hypothetical protein
MMKDGIEICTIIKHPSMRLTTSSMPVEGKSRPSCGLLMAWCGSHLSAGKGFYEFSVPSSTLPCSIIGTDFGQTLWS